jgi:hypothetical protein
MIDWFEIIDWLIVPRLERDDLSSLAEGRKHEIDRLHAKVREMNEEINR